MIYLSEAILEVSKKDSLNAEKAINTNFIKSLNYSNEDYKTSSKSQS